MRLTFLPRIFLVLFLTCALLAGCAADDDEAPSSDYGDSSVDDDNDDDDNDDDDNDTTPACDSGLFLSFDLTADERNVPFPSLVFLTDDANSPTGYRVQIGRKLVTYLEDIWKFTRWMLKDINELNGFAVSSPIWFPITAPPDLSDMPTGTEPSLDDPVFCAVLEDAGHPHYGKLWRMNLHYSRETKVLEARPHFPFAENTTYACVATTRLTPKNGDCYQQPPHLRYLLSDAPDPQNPDAALLEPHRRKWAPFVANLEAQYDVTPAQIVGATFFHTQWITRDLMIIHEKLDEMAQINPPTPGQWVRLGNTHPDVDAVWETTYQTVGWLHNGAFAYDENEEPIPGEAMEVTARLVLPKKGVNGHEGPFPVVIFGHGIQSSRSQVWTLGRTLAGEGIASIAIDWMYHGARSDFPEWVPEEIESVYRVLQFYNVFDPLQFRDVLRQDIADLFWLKYFIRGLNELDLVPYETGGDGIPDLDSETIYFAGHSHGSIHGGVYVALEPDIDTFFFNVGAVNYRKLLLGVWYGQLVTGILKVLDIFIDPPLFDSLSMYLDLLNVIIEPSDGYAYANHVLKDPLFERDTFNLLQQMVAYDNTLGGPASAEMAHSIGLTLLRPYPYPIQDLEVADAPVEEPAVFVYDTYDHHILFHSDSPFYEAVHNQAAVFFSTAYENGVATIINPLD